MNVINKITENTLNGIPIQDASKDFHEKAPAISFKKSIVGKSDIIASQIPFKVPPKA